MLRITTRIHYSDEVPCSSSDAAGASERRNDYHRQEHVSKESINITPTTTPHGSPKLKQRLAKHLSKSATELNGHNQAPRLSPKRAKSAAAPHSTASVLQKTQGFFSNLKHRWGRARSKDRLGRKSPNDFLEESTTDYAADYSSESSSVTQSPRHRSKTIGGSPLAKEFKATAKMAQVIQRFGGSMEGRIDEDPENGSNGMATASHEPYVTTTQIEALQAEEIRRKKEAQLRQYVFFQLRVHLKNGTDLMAMDKNGLSDPYVKMKIGGRLLHKSRTIHRDLNPVWDEVFVVAVEDPFEPIIVKVFDYDWGLQDDFMGSAQIDLTQLELGKAEDINLQLQDTNHPERQMGEILINLTLWPRSQEDKEMVSKMKTPHVVLISLKCFKY
ncbi:hypothetical protein GQX74_009931 [Glossina fuscipes]|nr:hypothetical protein GQX74_009931 [Glossina fuscipes]